MTGVERVVNLTDKPITEFVPFVDTIYITKMVSGYSYRYLCRFVSFERGMVTGDVMDFEPNWAHQKHELETGIRVRARLSKCYLWGRRPDDRLSHDHCFWFDPKTKKVKK